MQQKNTNSFVFEIGEYKKDRATTTHMYALVTM